MCRSGGSGSHEQAPRLELDTATLVEARASNPANTDSASLNHVQGAPAEGDYSSITPRTVQGSPSVDYGEAESTMGITRRVKVPDQSSGPMAYLA